MASKVVCRACLCSFEKKHHVDGALGSRLQRQFSDITYIKMKKNDGRPTSICFICCSLMQKLHKFIAMVQCTEKVLNYFIGQCLKITPETVFELSIKRPDFRVRHLKSISIDNLKIPLPLLGVKKEEVIDTEQQNVDILQNGGSSSASQGMNVDSLNNNTNDSVTKDCYSNVNVHDVSINFGHYSIILNESTDEDDYQKVVKPAIAKQEPIDNSQFDKLATEATKTFEIDRHVEANEANIIEETFIENSNTIKPAITNQELVPIANIQESSSIFALENKQEQSAEINKEHKSLELNFEQRANESMNNDYIAYSSMCLNLENSIRKETIDLDKGLSKLKDTFKNKTNVKLSTRDKLLFEEEHMDLESSIKKETMDINNSAQRMTSENKIKNTTLSSSIKKESTSISERIIFSDNDDNYSFMTPIHPKIKEEPFHFDEQEHSEAMLHDLYPGENLTNNSLTPNKVKQSSKQNINLNLSRIGDFSINFDVVQDCLIMENNASPIVIEDNMCSDNDMPLVINESKQQSVADDNANENSDNISNLDLSGISDGSFNLYNEDDFSHFETFIDMNVPIPNHKQKQNSSCQNSASRKTNNDETIGSQDSEKYARSTKAKFGLLFGESSDGENSPIKNAGDRPFRYLRPDFVLDNRAADKAPDKETNCTFESLEFGTQKPVLNPENKPKSIKNCAYELYTCEECFQTFKSRSGYSKHIKLTHAHQHCFECNFCSSTFDSPHHLKNHVKANHAKYRFMHHCNRCKNKYQSLKTLLIHKEQVHHEHIEIYSCDRCPKNFVDRLMYKYHVLFVHPPQCKNKMRKVP